MTHLGRRDGSKMARRAQRRGQAGFTMIEVCIVVGLMSMVLLPLFGFVVLGFSQTAATTDRNATASDIGLAQTYFARDAATAALLTEQDPGSYGWCTMPAGHTALVRMVEEEVRGTTIATGVALYTSGPQTRRDGTAVPGLTSLYRLECQRSSTTTRANTSQVGSTSQTQLVRDIGTSAARQAAGCLTDFPMNSAPPLGNVRNCDEMTLTFTPNGIPRLQASLRGRVVSGSDADQTINGVPAPTVSMVVSPEDPPRLPTDNDADPYQLDFAATATPPPGWTVIGWEWSVLRQSDDSVAPGFTASSTASFTHDFDPATHSGRYSVRVTVTVQGTVEGETVQQLASSYRVIDPANRPPVVRLNDDRRGDRVVTRCRSEAWSMTYAGAASSQWASYDPDDPYNESELRRPPSWSFTNVNGAANRTLTTEQVEFNALGLQSASLTLADSLGLTSTFTQNVFVDRSGVNFSYGDNGNDNLSTRSTLSFTRRSSGYREVFFRPKDWQCGGTLVNITLYECGGAATPGWTGDDYAPQTPRGRWAAGNVQQTPCASPIHRGTVFKCTQNEVPSPMPAEPPRWTYDLDQDPCTQSPNWAIVEGAPNGAVVDPTDMTDLENMPNDWRFRARWPESAPVAGNWFVQTCTDLHRSDSLDVWLDENEWVMPAQLCVNSRVFTRS